MFYEKRFKKVLFEVNERQIEVKKMTDVELKERMKRIRKEMKEVDPSKEKSGAENKFLPEVFSITREVASRVLGLHAYDVQILGAIALYDGRIAQMATGEGKTLVAIFPAVLESLSGRGAHVVFPNDYLAKRDWELMSQVFEFLEISSGYVINTMPRADRKASYLSDITYVENSCLAFDYLYDNLALKEEDIVQRELNFALIDEVDAVLLDAARSPFVISQKGMKVHPLVAFCDMVVRTLEPDDVSVSLDSYSATLTEKGAQKIEQDFSIDNIYSEDAQAILHYISNAIKAHFVYRDKVDYLVQNGKVVLIQGDTGRLSPSTRYQHGLHQAIEAKEGVEIKEDAENVSTVTYQNFFSLYNSIAGMTGTASTNETEFSQVYGLDVFEVQRNKPLARIDHPDVVYSTREKKEDGIVRLIRERHKQNQPMLIGCSTISQSIKLSERLTLEKIPHQLLNAENADEEAEIISRAGELGRITIATNMAGRGTDINVPEESLVTGGLLVIGTERNTSRRVDDQLRGRTGRQGNPGESVFHVSLDDELMEVYALESFRYALEALGSAIGDEAGVVQNDYVSKYIARTQMIVEGNDFQSRESSIQYARIDHQWWMEWSKFRNKILLSDEALLNFLFEDSDAEGFQIEFLRADVLSELDSAWKSFLIYMDEMKFSSSFAGYAQKNPVQEYFFQTGEKYSKLISEVKSRFNLGVVAKDIEIKKIA